MHVRKPGAARHRRVTPGREASHLNYFLCPAGAPGWRASSIVGYAPRLRHGALLLTVTLPAGGVPELEVVVRADDDDVAAKPGVLGQHLGDGDAAVRIDADLARLRVVEAPERQHLLV